VKKIISGIGESLGLRFGKNWLQQANSDGAPDPDALFAAYKAFQSAFDVATAEIEERGLTVDSLPLLFPRSDAATKRFEDVKQGIRAQVDLVGHLKRFMREYRPQYVFEQADSECVIFRNKLAPQVDALLIFDRHHLHGIGKSFGLQFGVDYPGAADFGQPPILQLFREDFFTLYRKNWEQRAWAYGTEEELARLLSGCRELFSTTLPLLEKRIVEALSPLPMKLPDLIPVFGSLTAREAFAQAIPIAKNWAEDIALISIGSNEHPGFGTLLGPSAGFDGRLLRPGFWSVVFHSPKRGANVMVTAPHTGAIRYATFKFPPMYLTLPSQPECPEKWIDSPMIAAAFGPVWKQHSENPEHRVVGTFYRLGARSQTQKEVIWEVHAMLAGAQRFDRRDIRATFDAESGRLINTQVDS
jgi:hypothetical protein